MRITFYGLNIHELRKGERLDAFLGSNKGWFTRIRNELVKTLNHKHILLGDSFASYLMPLGRRFVSEISRYYFRRGAFEDIEKIAAIIVTFSAVGRAGECSYITYSQAEWNSIYEILVLDWNEVKTDKQMPMPFSHDHNDFALLCFYFVMFCYFLVGGGSRFTTNPLFVNVIAERGMDNDDQTLVFPTLINNAANKVTSYLKDCVGEIDELPASVKICARGLRYGGLHEIQNNMSAGHYAALVRGGWAMDEKETRNTSSIYSVGNWESLMYGSKAIAGYPDLRVKVVSPTLEVLFELKPMGIEKLNSLLQEIYGPLHFNILDSHIRPFAGAAFASFLRFLPDFEISLGRKHPILCIFEDHLRTCQLTYSQVIKNYYIITLMVTT